jgi:hypothetical protein
MRVMRVCCDPWGRQELLFKYDSKLCLGSKVNALSRHKVLPELPLGHVAGSAKVKLPQLKLSRTEVLQPAAAAAAACSTLKI